MARIPIPLYSFEVGQHVTDPGITKLLRPADPNTIWPVGAELAPLIPSFTGNRDTYIITAATATDYRAIAPEVVLELGFSKPELLATWWPDAFPYYLGVVGMLYDLKLK